MNDVEVINCFKDGFISWGDETENQKITLADGTVKTWMKAKSCCFLPSHWEEVLKMLILGTQAYYSQENPGKILILLIWGNPSDQMVEQIFWLTRRYKQKASATFIDIKALVTSDLLLVNLMDGLDWQRSLEGVIKDGADSKPVWTWDE